MKLIFSFKTILIGFLCVVLFTGCDKEDDSGYPRRVSIEYKITGLSGVNGPLTFVSFTNETGGNNDLVNQSFPFSRTITRTLNSGDNATLSFRYGNGSGGTNVSIKLEIIVDGKVIKTETVNSSTAVVIAAIAHVFI